MPRLLSSLLLILGLSLPAAAAEFTALKGHGGPIMALTMANGRVVSASFDNSLGLWTGTQPRWLEGHAAAVTAVTVGPNGDVISGGDDFAVLHWADGPKQIGQHKGKVTSLAVTPDGQTVTAGSWDGSIMLWPLGPGEAAELPYPGAGVNALVYDPDGQALFAATSKGVLLRYEVGSAQTPRPLVRHGFSINRLVAGPGWVAYGAVDGATRIIDAQTGAPIADFTLGRRPVLALAYHAPTHQLAVGDGEGYILVIDTQEWRITRDFRAMRTGPVWALTYSPDGQMIYAGGLDPVVYGWPVELLDTYEPVGGDQRSFLRNPGAMSNGERQFMRKCSICHSLDSGPSRRAGPSLHGVLGRPAGHVPGYSYSARLSGLDLIWTDETIDALFEVGPDRYIPGSKMPQQIIAKPQDRADLIEFLRSAAEGN